MPSCWKADPRESVHSCRNRGEGFVEAILPEEQNTERKLVLPETIYNLTDKEPVIFVKNHTKVKGKSRHMSTSEIRDNLQVGEW